MSRTGWLLLLLLGLVAAGAGTVIYMGARGLRNNNPGNIRKSTVAWLGLAPQQTDDAFFQFTAPEYGIRAIAKILNSYRARGVATLSKIIATWAPPTENDTAAYIAAVAQNTGLSPDATITADHYPALIAAIIRHENGSQPYSAAQIAAGINMA